MRFLRVSAAYPLYLANFFSSHPEVAHLDYRAMKAAIDYDGFGHPDCWSNVLRPLGYECTDIILNSWPLQKAWALENGYAHLIAEHIDSKEIPPLQVMYKVVVQHAINFAPDILFFNNAQAELLAMLRQALPSIKLVVGWTGSAVASDILNKLDVVLSCSPEAVDILRARGLKSHLLHHSFDRRYIDRVGPKKYNDDFSFTGQIQMGKDFHELRGKILEEIAKHQDIQIYCDSESIYRPSVERDKRLFRSRILSPFKKIGLNIDSHKSHSPYKKYFASEFDLREDKKPKIDLKFIHPQVFGLDMFQLLKDSKVSLNIHADSSPRFASNMRIYEVPGMGGCLLTDWKENMDEMFVDGKEVVTYKNTEECIEKVRWLLSHATEREAIAKAGQRRVLSEHTFENRVSELDRIFRIYGELG